MPEHNSELFDPKCGFNSELYYEALAETLYLHYVLDKAPISEQYVDTRDKMLIPSKSNPVTPEKNCKECKEVKGLKNRTHYEEMTVLRYSLRSCQTEWISSEKDHAAHMIRFHQEKVFDVEVQRTINEAVLIMWSITRSKEVARLSELAQKRKRKSGTPIFYCSDGFMCCQVCHGHTCNNTTHSTLEPEKWERPRCRHLNWLFSWPARTKELRRKRVVSDRKSGSFLLAYTRERQ